MRTGYLHPQWADASLELNIPDVFSGEMHRYQIISRIGMVVRQGSFTGRHIFISTQAMPKGEKFVLRISRADELMHEGRFETC